VLLSSSLGVRGDLDFDGVDDAAEMASPITTATTDISMTAWVFKRTSSEGGLIMYNGTAASNGYGISLSDGSCNSGSIIGLHIGGVSCNATASATTLTDNTWYHVALTRGASTWRLYLDGVEIGTTTSAPSTPTAKFGVGGQIVGNNVNAIIAQAQFYTRELTAAEVASLYSSRQLRTLTGTGLLGWWWFDGGGNLTAADGATVIDRSGNGKDLTASDGANNTGCLWKAAFYITLP